MTGERCHVRRDPIEVPTPDSERIPHDIFCCAAVLGFETLRARMSGPPSLDDYEASLRVALNFVLIHDGHVR